MFNRTLVLSESCSRDDLRETRTACFYSKEVVMLLPGSQEARDQIIDQANDLWNTPKMAEFLRQKGMLQGDDDAAFVEAIKSLSREERGHLHDFVADSTPENLQALFNLVLDWHDRLLAAENEISALESAEILKTPLSNDLTPLCESLQETMDKQSQSVFADPSNAGVIQWAAKALPCGMSTVFEYHLATATTGKGSAASKSLGLKKSARKDLRKLQKQSGFLISNMLHSIFALLASRAYDATPVSGDADRLKLLSVVGTAFKQADSDLSKSQQLCRSLIHRTLPNVEYIPTQELIRVRERSLPELERLWTEIRKLSWESGGAEELLATKIDPAIQELDASVRSAKRQTLRGLRSVKPDFATAATVFTVSSLVGLTPTQTLAELAAVAAASWLPGLSEAVFQDNARTIQEQSPYGVLLTLKKSDDKAKRIRQRREKRQRRFQAKSRRRNR